MTLNKTKTRPKSLLTFALKNTSQLPTGGVMKKTNNQHFPLKSLQRDLIQPFSKRKKSVLPYHNNIPLFFELTGKLTQTFLKQRTNIYHQNRILGQRKGFTYSTLATKEPFPFSTS